MLTWPEHHDLLRSAILRFDKEISIDFEDVDQTYGGLRDQLDWLTPEYCRIDAHADYYGPLTHAGLDLADLVRDEARWGRVKSLIERTVNRAPLSVWVELLRRDIIAEIERGGAA